MIFCIDLRITQNIFFMGLITIQQIRNITEGIFGRGKDQYTQTRFNNIQRNFLLIKGEEWVNVDDGNLFHL